MTIAALDTAGEAKSTSRARHRILAAAGLLALLSVQACSGSNGSPGYNSSDPLDDKTPAEMRRQAQAAWQEFSTSMRVQLCFDLEVLDPSAAQALMRVDAPQMGVLESQYLYFEFLDLCFY